jgi:hypothetical protein
VGLGPTLGSLFDGAAHEGRHDERQHRIGRERGQRHPGQRHTVEQHDGHEDTGKHRVDNGAQGRSGQKVPNTLELSNPGHRVPDSSGLEVGKREPKGMPDHPHPEIDVDPAGGMRKEVCPQSSQHALERDEKEHADGDHVEGDQPMVHEHLVDDDLGGERSQKGEELQDQRGNDDLRERPTVLRDVREKPRKSEPPLVWTGWPRLCQQDETPGPFLLELPPGHNRWGRAPGHLDQSACLVYPQNDDVTPVPAGPEHRKGSARQPLPASRDFTRLETDPPRGGYEPARGPVGTGLSKLSPQSVEIQGNSMESGDGDQAQQPALGGARIGRHRVHSNLDCRAT